MLHFKIHVGWDGKGGQPVGVFKVMRCRVAELQGRRVAAYHWQVSYNEELIQMSSHHSSERMRPKVTCGCTSISASALCSVYLAKCCHEVDHITAVVVF